MFIKKFFRRNLSFYNYLKPKKSTNEQLYIDHGAFQDFCVYWTSLTQIYQLFDEFYLAGRSKKSFPILMEFFCLTSRGTWFKSPWLRSLYIIWMSWQKGDINQDLVNFTFGKIWIYPPDYSSLTRREHISDFNDTKIIRSNYNNNHSTLFFEGWLTKMQN